MRYHSKRCIDPKEQLKALAKSTSHSDRKSSKNKTKWEALLTKLSAILLDDQASQEKEQLKALAKSIG